MLFHSALGQLHGLGDLTVLAAVDAVEQKDLPGTFRQGTQCGFDALQVMIDLQRLFRCQARARFIQRLRRFGDAFAAAFAAQVVNGQVASATQQVSVQCLDLDLGAAPEAQEQLLHQVRCGGAAAHPAADQGLHACTLGHEHLDEARACAVAVGLGQGVTRQTRPAAGRVSG